MKLSTLLSVPSSGGLSSSARNAADSTTSNAFGSLLNGMVKDGSAGTSKDSPSGQQKEDTTGSFGAFEAGDITPALNSNGQRAATTTGSEVFSVAGAVVPTVLSLGQLAARTTGSVGVIATGALAPTVISNGRQAAGTTVSASVVSAGALAPAVISNGRQAVATTVSAGVIAAVSLMPTGVPAVQSALDTTVSPEIAVVGASLSTDFSSGRQAADTTGIASASLPGVSDGKSRAVGSLSASPSGDEQSRSDAAVTATEPVQGSRDLAHGTDVASLLTLATRAADAPQNVAAPSAPAQAAFGATIVASGVKDASLGRSVGSSEDTSADASGHASGRIAKKRSASEVGDGSNGEAQSTTALVPQIASGFVVATGTLVNVTVPNASGDTTTPASADPLAPAKTLAPGKDTATGAAPASTATQPLFADLPQTAAVDDSRAPSESPGIAAPIDVAVVPGTVQVESHLGFFRAAPAAGGAAPRDSGSEETRTRAVESSGLATGPIGPTALRRTGLAEAAAASPVTGARAAGAGEADARLASPATTDDIPSPSGPLSLSPTSKSVSEEPSRVAPDTAGAAHAAPVMSIVLPSSQTTAPVAVQVADGVAALAVAVPDENQLGTQVAPARTMALQLSPAGLGTLTVHLHIVGKALDVRLEASEGSTAALIDRDRDALSGALRSKDYQLQSLSVTTQDATMPGGTNAQRGTDTGSAATGSSGPSRDGGSFGGRSGGQGPRDTPDQAARPSRGPTDDLAVERGGSSLFV